MRPLDDCIKEDKSKADEMFEEFGYKKYETKNADIYMEQKLELAQIGFNKLTKVIFVDMNFITMQELQAINEKCKELGWL